MQEVTSIATFWIFIVFFEYISFWTEERLQEEKIIGFCFKKDGLWTMDINDLEQNERRVVL